MQTITVIGLVASVCTGTSMLPQLVKIFKSKKADDISFLMLAVLMAGLSCWVVYGYLQEDIIIIISNGFSFLIAALILILGLRINNKH